MSKKRITTELLYLGLVITLLRGNPRQIGNYDNVISTNFFNDVDHTDILVEGPNWAFSRTNYHRLRMYMDPGVEHFKSLGGSYESYYDDPSYYPDSFDNDNELDLEEEIYLQQSRLLLLSQLNTAYARKDPIQTFRDITAYLVSDTTTQPLPTSLATLPVAPIVSSGGSSGPSTTSVPASPVTDSGNDSGDSGDEGVRLSFSSESETDHTEDSKNEAIILELMEQDSQFMEEVPSPTSIDTGVGVEMEDLLPGNVKPEPENENQMGYLNDLTLNSNLDIQSVDPNEFLDFIINNHYDDADQLGAASLPISNPPPRSLLSHEWGESPGFDQSLVSDLFDFDQLEDGRNSARSEEMEWTLAEEEAHLTFYKNFNEVANTETLLQSVPIQVIEGGAADEVSTTQPVDVELVGVTTLDQAIDDWLETDSGVFDSSESPTAETSTTFNFEVPSSPSGSHLSDPIDGESGGEEDDMIQAASIHPNGRPTPHHPNHQARGFQVHARMPGLLRGGANMDQRWQELTNILSLQHPDANLGSSLPHPFAPHYQHHVPPPHHHFSAPPPTAPYDTARSVLLQNGTLPPPDVTYSSMGPPPHLGSVVSSSMHLTNNNTDPMIDPSTHYKMIESSHDHMIYYPNTANNTGGEMNNQSTEGFLSSILNDELMDMAMHEGMFQMRMLDNGVGSSSIPHGSSNGGCGPMGAGAMGAEDRMEASSDSAVSSMGSERVPLMTDPSDSEWVDPDSHPHSSHDSSPYSLEYSGSKSRGYDYYGKERGVGTPVAQKKHHMFGKRFQQEQGVLPYVLPHHPGLPYPSSSGLHPSSPLDSLDMKYGCGVEFARHQNDLRPNGGLGSLDSVHNNHTYALPPSHAENSLSTFKAPKPPSKDKPSKMNQDLDRFAEESLSRDEKRARGMNLPITTDDIINLPMDEFNERLSKYDLSEPQLSLIRDIRRRGKNKVAAQNCRKRKLDQILQLADEVQRIRERKQTLLREQQELGNRRQDVNTKYQNLYKYIFTSIRDPQGNSISQYDFSLQQAADGSIIMVPKNANIPSNPSRRDKSKDDYNKKAE